MTRTPLVFASRLHLLIAMTFQAIAIVALAPAAWCQFYIAPYLQVGDRYKVDSQSATLLLRWVEQADAHHTYKVEVQHGDKWQALPPPTSVALSIQGQPGLTIYSEQLAGLSAGTTIPYHVLVDSKPAFSGEARTPRTKGQPCKLIIVGDCGDGSNSEKKLAARMCSRNADLAVIVGDIVYSNGRLSEYLEKFFPVYNADKQSPAIGGPMLRNLPFIACPGNHDTCVEGRLDGADLAACPDGLAYYYLWRQPLNGPALDPKSAPHLRGPQESTTALLKAADGAFPNMSNFSLDYGSAHIVCLDANDYADWTDDKLQQWLDHDLEAAASMPWRIVVFHQACFSSDKNHFEDQQMRVLAPIFEKRNVQVVFSGHTHSYQRSMPIKFTPSQPIKRSPEGFIYGRWQLDKKYSDKPDPKPQGVIYVVTGGGGAPLSNDPGALTPEAWQPFTKLYRNDTHCFSECEITDSAFVFRQVADNGKVIDAFQLRN